MVIIKQVGRPKKKRKIGVFETFKDGKLPRNFLGVTCGSCGNVGHNARGCTGQGGTASSSQAQGRSSASAGRGRGTGLGRGARSSEGRGRGRGIQGRGNGAVAGRVGLGAVGGRGSGVRKKMVAKRK